MKTLTLIFVFAGLIYTQLAAQTDEELAKGISFIETQTYTAEENTEILKMYENLRVADVSDGMDMVGLPNTGLVDPAIHPDWVDHEELSHIIRGIAVTARYVPTQKPDRPKPDEDFLTWEGHFYSTYSNEAFTKVIQKGSVVVLDDVEDKDIGSIGSNNILGWYKAGAVGVVTDASSRDTDEIAIQKVPIYLRKKGRGICFTQPYKSVEKYVHFRLRNSVSPPRPRMAIVAGSGMVETVSATACTRNALSGRMTVHLSWSGFG